MNIHGSVAVSECGRHLAIVIKDEGTVLARQVLCSSVSDIPMLIPDGKAILYDIKMGCMLATPESVQGGVLNCVMSVVGRPESRFLQDVTTNDGVTRVGNHYVLPEAFGEHTLKNVIKCLSVEVSELSGTITRLESTNQDTCFWLSSYPETSVTVEVGHTRIDLGTGECESIPFNTVGCPHVIDVGIAMANALRDKLHRRKQVLEERITLLNMCLS